MKKQSTYQQIIKAFALALTLLFAVLFWQFLTVTDVQIETNAIEVLGKYFETKQVVTK